MGGLVAVHHALEAEHVDHALRDLRARSVAAEEWSRREILVELRAVGQRGGAEAAEEVERQAAGVSLGLQHERRHGAHQHRTGDALARQSVVYGESVSDRVDHGGRRLFKNKKGKKI